MKITLVLFAVGLGLASAAVVTRNQKNAQYDEVCYDDYGCFTTDSPWTSFYRPLAGLPNPPWGVGTRFLLFTRQNQYEDFELVPDNEIILADSPYDNSKNTIFLIHGFTGSHLDDWVVKARNALLEKRYQHFVSYCRHKRNVYANDESVATEVWLQGMAKIRMEDINVISVDWAPGCDFIYLTAVDNVRMVGAQLIRIIDFLVAKANLDLGAVRIVAHSIGTHAASYAGEHYGGAIGHITALDPSRLYFDDSPELVRIDKTDAAHVQVIHTNGDWLSGMGISEAIGHVDIYVNGGDTQPGCEDLLAALIGAIANLLQWEWEEPFAPFACSHYRAGDYYVESIQSECPYVAHKCDSQNDYNNGLCYTDCSVPGYCALLGYTTNDVSSSRGTFFLNTDDAKPFCHQIVQFDTNVDYNQDKTYGKLTVEFSFAGENFKTTVFDGKMTAGQILYTWANIPSDIMKSTTEKPTLRVRYTRDGVFDEHRLSLDTITVSTINEQFQLERVYYNAVTLESGEDATLYPQ